MIMGLSLTPRAFKRLFPNASISTFAANFGDGANPRDYAPGVSDAEPEPDEPKALDGVFPGEKKSEGRAHVRITRFAFQLLDEDNLGGSAKPLLDCLAQAGLIFDDSPKYIDLEVTQQLVMRREDERTEVAITWL